MMKGLYIALVTPFDEKGNLNEAKLRELVRFHIDAGTNGLVPCATTSENPTYTWEEHFRIIEIVVEEAKGRLEVVAGCGTNSTTRSIENIKRARDLGADGAMVVTPYYNKPTQEGLFAHFIKLADDGGLPLMLYNVPGRTGVNMLPATVARVAKHENIVAIKEASGNLEQMAEIVLRCGDTIDLLSGDDNLTFPILAIGGTGVVSVVGNIVPKDVLAMLRAFDKKKLDEARSWHYKLFPLCKAMFIETNPMPVKEAMNLLGMGVGDVRLPLVRMLPENAERLRAALADYGILS
ncbi:MAG TPA: 4-hydroxy-tetrahydrodipicolinate synthase [Candidatus Eisenbacteria bacterium]|uniref:4-hydroxy-tetrahydrodipicolinate synthase n=1 Tax=Eiseniibacteriota bacterium TaxID=2212470 RepID=A0A7V2F3A2_UNCEI|nr:4-hydroxy-tetrahydrodipicolinate synthase [Candidatus Eisenbacteria bacterium]